MFTLMSNLQLYCKGKVLITVAEIGFFMLDKADVHLQMAKAHKIAWLYRQKILETYSRKKESVKRSFKASYGNYFKVIQTNNCALMKENERLEMGVGLLYLLQFLSKTYKFVVRSRWDIRQTKSNGDSEKGFDGTGISAGEWPKALYSYFQM